MEGLSDGLPDQFLEGPTDLLVLVRAIVAESGREPCGPFELLVDLTRFFRPHINQLLFVHRIPHRNYLGEPSILECPRAGRWMSRWHSIDVSTHLAIVGYLKLQRVWLNRAPLPNPKPVSGGTR